VIGDPCTQAGQACAITPPAECGQVTIACTSGTWQLQGGECPISTAKAKRDISYVSPGEAAHLSEELLAVRLARYRYKSGEPSAHLGFIIEDLPVDSPAVLSSRERVDLYGYVSMAVATIQEQEKRIEKLEHEVSRMKEECKTARTR
jgi:hypothetical protein